MSTTPADVNTTPLDSDHYRRQLQTVAENATLALFIMDDQQRCSYMNPAAEALTGFKLEELQGQPLHYYVHHKRPDGSHYPLEECPIDRAFPQNMREQGEEIFVHKDGHLYPVSFTASPIRQGDRTVGTIIEARNITEDKRKEAERQQLFDDLQRERSRLAEIFRRAPAVIATYSGRDHVVTMVNPTWEKMLGRTDVIGKKLADLFPEVAGTGLFEILDEVFRSGKPYVGNEMEIPIDRKGDGTLETTWWNFVFQPITDAAGNTTDIFVHAVEISEQVQARHAVEEQARELARVARAFEASNRELDQFAYVASHDLKAPLRGISNLSQWIEEDLGAQNLSPETREHLALLRGRIHRMEALIDGILQYSRAGRVREKPERVDLVKLAEEAVDLLAPPQSIDIEIANDMPVIVTEKLPLQQVLQNLLSNAIKYLGRADGRVRIAAVDAGEMIELSVSDNGPGIAPEFHDRIFGLFQTLESRDRVEATGIGLAIVQKTVESRGGRVRVESSEGKGTTFHFTWPKAPKEEGHK